MTDLTKIIAGARLEGDADGLVGISVVESIIAGIRERDDEIAKLREVCETLLEYVPATCDQDNAHVKVWCCQHQQKHCTGAADVAKARAVLAKCDALDGPTGGA